MVDLPMNCTQCGQVIPAGMANQPAPRVIGSDRIRERVVRGMAWREGFRYGLALGIVATIMVTVILSVLGGL